MVEAGGLSVEQIAEIIERLALSQMEAAELMGLGQLKVSALVRGFVRAFQPGACF